MKHPTGVAAATTGRAMALPGQVVLAFQGGGALNAYQGGVYQALHEAGIEPDWVIGTSSGAINAGIIAGNPPEKRLECLHKFWTSLEFKPWWEESGWACPGGRIFESTNDSGGGAAGGQVTAAASRKLASPPACRMQSRPANAFNGCVGRLFPTFGGKCRVTPGDTGVRPL